METSNSSVPFPALPPIVAEPHPPLTPPLTPESGVARAERNKGTTSKQSAPRRRRVKLGGSFQTETYVLDLARGRVEDRHTEDKEEREAARDLSLQNDSA